MEQGGARLDVWLRPRPLDHLFVLEVDHVRLHVPLLLVVLVTDQVSHIFTVGRARHVQHGKRGHILPVQKLHVFDVQLVQPRRVALVPAPCDVT